MSRSEAAGRGVVAGTLRLLAVLLASLLGLALIVLLLGGLWLSMPPGERWLARQIEQRASQALGQPFRVGGLETDLLHRFLLTDLQLRPDSSLPADRATSLSIHRLSLSWRPHRLLLGELAIGKVHIDSARIQLGADSLASLMQRGTERPEGDGEPSSLAWSVQQVNLDHIELQQRGDWLPIEGSTRSLSLSASQEGPGRWTLRSEAERIDLLWRGQSLSLHELRLRGRIDTSRAILDSLHLGLAASKLGLSGELDWSGPGSPSLDLQLALDSDLPRLAAHPLVTLPPALAWLRPQQGRAEWRGSLLGTVASPRFGGQLRLQQLRLSNELDVDGRLRVDGDLDSLRLQRFELKMLGGEFRGHGALALDSLLHHRLVLEVEDLSLRKMNGLAGLDTTGYQGVLYAGLRSRGPLREPFRMALSGDARIKRASISGRDIGSLQLHLSFHDGQGKLRAGHGQARLDIEGKAGRERTEAKVRLTIPQLGDLLPLAGLGEARGWLEAEGRVEGPYRKLNGKLSLRGGELRVQGVPADTLWGVAQLRMGELRVDSLQLRGAGWLDEPLGPLLALDSLRGGFAYGLQWSGNLAQPRLELKLRGHQLRYGRALRLEELWVEARLKDSLLHIQRMDLLADTLALRVEGNIEPWQRRGEGTVRAALWSGAGTLAEEQTLLRHEVLVDSVQHNGRRAPSLTPWLLEEPEAGWGAGAVQVSLSAPGPERLRLRAQLQQAAVSLLAPLDSSLHSLKGRASGSVQLDREGTQLTGRTKLTLQRPGYGGVVIDSLVLKAALLRQRLQLSEVRLSEGAASLSITGQLARQTSEQDLLGLSLTRAATLRARLDGLDLAPLGPSLHDSLELRGRLEAQLTLTGSLHRPSLRGGLRLEQGSLALRGNPESIQDLRLIVHFEDSVARIDTLRAWAAGRWVTMEGQVQRKGWTDWHARATLREVGLPVLDAEARWTPEQIHATVAGDSIDLAWLQPLLPGARRLEGMAQGDLVVEGTHGAPQLHGELLVSEMLLDHVRLPEPLEQGQLQLRFIQDRITLDTLSGRFGKQGLIQASGELRQSEGGWGGLTLELRGRKLHLQQRGVYQFRLDSLSLRVRQSRDRYAVSGQLRLGESRYVEPVNIRDIVDYIQRPPRSSMAMGGVLDQIDLDVDIIGGKQLWIDNNLARLRLTANLTTLGLLRDPVLSGRIEVLEGYILYLDRRFEVEQGVLDFINPDRNNPNVTLFAVAEVAPYQTEGSQAYRVMLTLSGPVDDVRVQLESDPPLDRASILSLLTLGTTRRQLVRSADRSGGTSLQDIIAERAGQLTSQRISGYVAKQIGGALGLSSMSIRGNLFNFSDSWGPQLLASKKITDRMEVTYTTRIGRMNEQGIQLEYKLNEHWYLEGETNQRGDAGLDLKYKLRIR